MGRAVKSVCRSVGGSGLRGRKEGGMEGMGEGSCHSGPGGVVEI